MGGGTRTEGFSWTSQNEEGTIAEIYDKLVLVASGGKTVDSHCGGMQWHLHMSFGRSLPVPLAWTCDSRKRWRCEYGSRGGHGFPHLRRSSTSLWYTLLYAPLLVAPWASTKGLGAFVRHLRDQARPGLHHLCRGSLLAVLLLSGWAVPYCPLPPRPSVSFCLI